MSKSQEAIFNYQLLAWAVKRSGYDVATIAKKSGVKEAQLSDWQQGNGQPPTVNQLRNIGKVLKRPLAFFYLPEVPTDFQPIRDYRRLPTSPALPQSPELIFEIRKAYERREIAIDLMELLEVRPPNFNLSTTLPSDPEAVGQQIRKKLGITFEDQTHWRSPHHAFNYWRRALETSGILVFQTSEVALAEIRGFSINETPLPAVVVNMKDRSPRARVFTLIHELCHIMLRMPGVCNLDDRVGKVEVFCNAVAAAAIVPRVLFIAETKGHKKGTEWNEEEIGKLSRRFSASKEVIVRRLVTCGLATEEFYQRKRQEYQEEYERWSAEQKQKDKEKEGFAPPYQVSVGVAGPLFTKLVLDGYDHEKITSSDVAGYLELRLKHLPRVRGIVATYNGHLNV